MQHKALYQLRCPTSNSPRKHIGPSKADKSSGHSRLAFCVFCSVIHRSGGPDAVFEEFRQ
jgi:hypothetical protein